jgi:cytoplasmic iron level regulating protein YaaA (DUF328/UPF0246 family)
MIIVINSSKTLDFQQAAPNFKCTIPEFMNDADFLVKKMQALSEADIAELMGISTKLAKLNVERYQQWQTPFTSSNARPSLMAFKGDVYSGINVENYSSKEFDFAQKHLRILAGLYGILRPLDLIQPYRLEMATKLSTPKGKDLYQFWGNRISESLNEMIKREKSGILINLCSAEYLKSVKPKLLDAAIITPVFKEYKDGSYRMVTVYAKKARGLMCNYIVQNRLEDVEALKDFNVQGYKFIKKMSTDIKWLFARKQ